MSLQAKKKGPMREVPMSKTAFRKLINYLSSIRPVSAELEGYLFKMMTAEICVSSHNIHVQGEITNRAYFISHGLMMAYTLDQDGAEHVLRIYFPGDIVAGNSFMNSVPCSYYLRIFKDAFVLPITRRQMQTAYLTIPETSELARCTFASFEEREVEHYALINKSIRERIRCFYKAHPEMLIRGKKLKDGYIASYLHLAVPTLKSNRRILLREFRFS